MAATHWIFLERSPAVDFTVTMMKFGIHVIIDYVYSPFTQLRITREDSYVQWQRKSM